jgi:PAS domain S-box-containing protein
MHVLSGTDKDVVIHRWFHAHNERDIDGLCAAVHPHVELVPTRFYAPPGTSYHGRQGVRTLATHTFENFPDARAEWGKSRDVGAWTMVRAMLLLAADEDPYDAVFMFRFEEGLIRRIHGFNSEAEAIKSAERPPGIEFRELFDSDPGPIALLDDSGCMADLNPAACALLELEYDQLVGRKLAGFVAEEGRADWQRCWEAVRLKGRANGRLALISGGGRRHDVDFWASAHYTPGRELALLRVAGPEPRWHQRVLTRREREIFQLLALGLSAPQIAERLVLSPLTVRTHVQNGMNRLGANTRVQAIAMALARGEIHV